HRRRGGRAHLPRHRIGSRRMGDGPRSVGWTVAAVVLGSVFTFVLWTVVTGDATTGAGYAGVVFVVLIASALLERPRPAGAARRAQRQGRRQSGAPGAVGTGRNAGAGPRRVARDRSATAGDRAPPRLRPRGRGRPPATGRR